MPRISNREIRHRIEWFFEERDWHVVCRKRKHAYSIYDADDGAPLAKLRPTGNYDEVEIYRWHDDRWIPVSDFGLVLPLDEALGYIVTHEHDVFLSPCTEDSEDSEQDSAVWDDKDVPETDEAASNVSTCKAFAIVHAHMGLSSMLGAAFGGAFSGGWMGIVCGATGGILAAVLFVFVFRRIAFRRVAAVRLVAPSVVVCAAAAGLIGSATNAWFGGGLTGTVTGILVASVSAVALWGGRWMTWTVGFLAGLNLGVLCIRLLGLHEQFVGVLSAAILATGSANLFRIALDRYLDATWPKVNDYLALSRAAREQRRLARKVTAA